MYPVYMLLVICKAGLTGFITVPTILGRIDAVYPTGRPEDKVRPSRVVSARPKTQPLNDIPAEEEPEEGEAEV